MNRLSLLVCLIFTGLGLAEAQTTSPATFQGTVQIQSSQSALGVRERGSLYRSRYQAKKTPSKTENTNPLEDAIIYLTRLDQSIKPDPLSNSPELNQKNVTFHPRVTPVTVGSTVSIVNMDRIYHNVFSKSPVKSFNIGKRLTGETIYQAFEKPGVVQVFCNIHTNMSAYILVLDTPFFQRVSGQGTFRFDGLPPGTYRVEIFHPDFKGEPVEIRLEAGSDKTMKLTIG